MIQTTLSSIVTGVLLALQKEPTPLILGVVQPGADPVSSMPLTGVGLRLTPRLKPRIALRDWLAAQVTAAESPIEAFLRNDAAAVMHWPTFLMQAFKLDVGPFPALARRTLRVLRPFYRAASPALAEYFRLYDVNEVFRSDQRIDALNQHLERLLASARGRRIVAGLADIVRAATDVHSAKNLARCYSCLLRETELARIGQSEDTAAAAQQCPACRMRSTFAKECSVFSLEDPKGIPPALMYLRPLRAVLPRSQSYKGMAPAVFDIAWLLEGQSDFDGAWREGSRVSVNWYSYGERLLERDWTPDDTRDEADVAELAEAAKQRVLAVANRFGAVHEAETAAANDPTRTVFRYSQLTDALRELISPGMQSHRRRLREHAVLKHSPRPRKFVQVTYDPGTGEIAGSIRRHGARWALRIPLDLVPGIALPARQRLQRSADPVGPPPLGRADIREYWWHETDLNLYADSCAHKGYLREAEALGALALWFRGQCNLFRSSPKVFKDALYSAAVAARVAAAQQGEPRRLGKFSADELEVLSLFLLGRGVSEAAFHGPLTEREWQQLGDKLPFRSRDILLAKISELGFAYAKKYGYIAYLKSGFGISKSSVRRSTWLRKGVKL